MSSSIQDTIQAKTNRHSDKIKGGTRGLRILKKQQMTFSKFHLSLSLSLTVCVSFSASTLLSPSFPLTHPLMVIYLAGKGFAFSPERSTTGREQKPSSLRKKKKKREKRVVAGRIRRKEQKKKKKYIIHVSLPSDTDSASHSPSQL